jgi:hypothetical protein
MPNYRIYALDAYGQIYRPSEIITCETDEEAVEKAKSLADGRALELWQRDRRVARIEPRSSGGAPTPVPAA